MSMGNRSACADCKIALRFIVAELSPGKYRREEKLCSYISLKESIRRWKRIR